VDEMYFGIGKECHAEEFGIKMLLRGN
jgi:hypothetical protein